MKKYSEILEEIIEVEDNIKEIKECTKSMNLEKDKRDTMVEKLKYLHLKNAILTNNAKVALFFETVPPILKVLEFYENKRLGSKTIEKIRAEIKGTTGCIVAIKDDRIIIYAKDHSITIGTNYENPILIDNKIQNIPFEEYSLWYDSKEYVEDIPKRITDLKVAYLEAKKKQRELDNACKIFNDLVVGDIDHISMYKAIYNRDLEM